MNKYFLFPVIIFFIITSIIVFYLQFIYEDWKFISPKKIIPEICNDKGELKIITLSQDYYSDRSFKDTIDISSDFQFHAIYLLPCEKIDRKFDINKNIQSSLYVINKWFIDKTNNQKINFDKKIDNDIDVTFIRVNKTMNWFTGLKNPSKNKEDSGSRIENIILSNTNLFNNFNKKKFIVFFEGWEKRKSLNFDICGKSRFDGKVAIFFTSGKWKQDVGNNKKMFSCVKDSLNEINDLSFGDSEVTILHEILHTLGSPPKCARNLDSDNIFHVNDNEKDILNKLSGDIFLDFNNDDYYKHNIKNCPDLVDSKYLIKF